MSSIDHKVMEVIIDKLEVIQKDVSAIKVEQAIMKTNMERNKEAELPSRVDTLEAFRDRMLVWGAITMTVIPAGVTILLKKLL